MKTLDKISDNHFHIAESDKEFLKTIGKTDVEQQAGFSSYSDNVLIKQIKITKVVKT